MFIVLYGMNGICTEQVDLTDSKKKRKECFNRGSVDVFVREVSQLLEKSLRVQTNSRREMHLKYNISKFLNIYSRKLK